MNAPGGSIDDAGHAIAKNLGGSGSVISNIFPQSININRGSFRQFEQQIAKHVDAGNEVYARVVPQYANSVTTRPTQILYQVRINGSTITRMFDNPESIK